VRISSGFDAGAIEVLGQTETAEGVVVDLAIRADDTTDAACDFRQWFHFRVQGLRGERARLRLTNAAACTYPGGWEGYQAVASHDRVHWSRVPTRHADGVLEISHDGEHESTWYAYFEPYSWERHMALVGRAACEADVTIEDLGPTVDGRDLDLIRVGPLEPGRPRIWVIARQHPGETMAEWFVEGMLERLFDESDPLSRSLRARCTWLVVPNMNPDGSVRGNLRANAAGANLNREWMAPDPVRSPEVLAVRNRLLETGCDFFLDVHGDEALPWVFVAGSEMLPGFTPEQARRQSLFCERFMQASPDFQTEHGYPAGKYHADSLRLASKWVGHSFGCLSLTLEMPFKDNAGLPDARTGWSAQRSKRLGAAVLAPIQAVSGVPAR
jgi:murein tripeptide amidase MpaA